MLPLASRRRTALLASASFSTLLAACALTSCRSLDDLVETGCGDRILSTGEDCDNAPRVEGGVSFECIPPGAESACHYKAVEGVCPEGLRVGLDGVCRRPAGTFDVKVPIPLIATHAQIASFGGDGSFQLVLASDRGDVPFYFDGRTPIDPGFAFGRVLQSGTSVGDLTGDGRDDVLVAISNKLLTFQGSTFDLRTYASDDPGGRFRVVPVDAPAVSEADPSASAHPDLDVFARLFECGGPGPIQPLCATAGTDVVLYASVYESPTLLPNGAIQRPYDDIGTSARARLSALRPCRDLALLSAGQAELDVVPMCPVCDAANPPMCTLDPTVTVALEDATKPACPSILPKAAFPLSTATQEVLLVEGECPDGRHALYGVQGLTAAFLGFAPNDGFLADESGGGSTIQGVADLNEDGFVDFVTTSQVYLTHGAQLDPGVDFPVYYAPAGWSRASVIDLNGDGWLDIIGARLDVGLDILLGGPFSAFAPGFVPTTAQVAAFTVNDFDGDGAGDIFIAEGGAQCAANARLSVAFGRSLGFPDPPVSIGETPWTSEIVSARVYDPSSTLDSIADAVLVSNCESTSLHAAALFNGSSSRILSSPYVLRQPAIGAESSVSLEPEGITTADVVHPGGWGGDNLPDLIAFGSAELDDRPTLLVVPGSSGANLVATSGLDASNVLRLAEDAAISGVSVAAGDVTGDAEPEILAGSTVYVVDPVSMESRTAASFYVVTRADLEGATAIRTQPIFVTTAASFSGVDTRVAALDVDGNGELDAVFLATESSQGEFVGEPGTSSSAGSGGGEGVGDPWKPSSELLVAFRTGGVLGAACAIPSGAAVLTDFTLVDVGEPSRAFVVSGSTGALRYQPSGGDPCAGTLAPFPASGRELSVFADPIRGLAASDLDGDGIEDLAVLGDTGTTVYYQSARAGGDAPND